MGKIGARVPARDQTVVMTDRTYLEAGDGHQFTAHVARPTGTAKGALVVIQEIFGVNAHIQSVCDRFAADGWIAVAPALFDRAERDVELLYTMENGAHGKSLREQLALDDCLADVAACADAAAAEVGSSSKVGIIGYCWGGSIAAAAACRLPHLFGAAVGYYGGQIIPLLAESPGIPLQLHFGELDRGIPLSDVDAIGAAWPNVPITVHEGAGHGFNCDLRPDAFHADASAAALAASMEFFAEHLG